jgi:hypothetical protein
VTAGSLCWCVQAGCSAHYSTTTKPNGLHDGYSCHPAAADSLLLPAPSCCTLPLSGTSNHITCLAFCYLQQHSPTLFSQLVQLCLRLLCVLCVPVESRLRLEQATYAHLHGSDQCRDLSPLTGNQWHFLLEVLLHLSQLGWP